MNKTIILGDVHLGANLSQGKINPGQLLNSRVIDQRNLLEWVLDQAEDNDVGDIIITGDIFEEPNPPHYLLSELFSWLNKCRQSDVNVHIIMGNHDLVRTVGQLKSPLDVVIEANLEGVHIYKDIETIFIDDVAYTLMPYRDRKSIGISSNEEALNKIQSMIHYELLGIPQGYKKVVVGHFAIEGSIPVGDEIDDLSNEIFLKPEDFNGFDYIFMGHVHGYQVMQKENPYVSHVGSMDLTNYSETNHKKYIILFDTSLPDNFKKMQLPTRQLKKLTVVIPEGIEDTTKYVVDKINEEKLSNAIVKVEIELDGLELKSINKNIVEKALMKLGVSSVSNISESKKTKSIKKKTENEMTTKMDVKSAISMYADACVDENKRDGFKKLANSLYLESISK